MNGKGDAKETVYKYLKSQNRPYSANDVMQNLHNEFGKTIVQKALDELARDNRIHEKTYGKQKIYSAIQDECDGNKADMETELLQLDSRIDEVTENLRTMENELRITETALKDLKRQPSMDECISEKEKLEEDIKNLTVKVQSLSGIDTNISEMERSQMYKDNETYIKEYRKRKRICMDILNSILENCPKPKKALIEEIGIETDEDVGFKLPS